MSSLLRGTRLLLSYTLRRITHVASPKGGQRLSKEHLPWASSTFTRNFSTNMAPEPVAPVEGMEIGLGKPVERLTGVQRRLELMDSNVRWRGRVDLEDVQDVLNLVKQAETIADQQALMLLRCSGALMVKESPAKRMKIFDDIWSTLMKKNVILRTSHYNAAIRIRLENKVAFLPTDILAEMESSEDAKPNRVTFQLLIEQYCQDGDLSGATTILQHMKAQKFTITEAVFNQLIVGHLKTGDVEGSKGVISSMRAAGLRLSGDTYKGILCCYAEKGDIEAIEQTLTEADQEEVHIPASHLYATVLMLVDHGHEGLVEQVLSHIKEGANHDALNAVHQLIARGHDDTAIMVYLRLSQDNQSPDSVSAGCRAVLRTMILNDRPIEKLLAALESLKMGGLHLNENIEVVALMALTYKKSEVALAAIKLMSESETPVRPHYFWPVLLQYAKAKNTDGICNVVAVLVETAVQNEDYIPTLYKAFQPLLAQLKDTTAAIARLQEAGVKTEDINTIQLLYLLNKGDFTEAQQFLDSDLDLTFHTEEIRSALSAATSRGIDKATISKVTAHLESKYHGGRGYFGGIVLNSMLSQRGNSAQDKVDFVQAWVDQSIPINSISLDIAKNALMAAGVSDSLLQELSDMSVPDKTQTIETKTAKTLSVDELEMQLKARKPRDRDINTIRKHLLSKYCQVGDVKNADALRSSLEEKNFVFDLPTLRQLSYLAAVYKKDLSEALMYKQQMETTDPSFHQYQQLVLSIATLQAEKGLFDDAVQSLVDYGTKHSMSLESEGGERRGYAFIAEAETLIKTFRAGSSPAEVRHLVDVVFKYRFTLAGLYSLLVEVTSAYIAKGDLDGLMDVLKAYYHTYERVPIFQDVFRTLIAQKDAQKLEQVVDMVTNLKGSVDVLLKLAMACIDCDQTSKAAKIMGTPGLRANMAVLKTGIDEYVRLRKERELRDLVEVSRDLFGVNREEMLFGIVRFYGSQKDADGCQSVLDMYDEQNVVPSPRTLRYIANVFTSQGKEVHFDVPAIDPQWENGFNTTRNESSTSSLASPTKTNDLERRLNTSAQAGDIDDVVAAFKNGITGTQPVSVTVLCQVARQFHRSRDGRIFSRFLKVLAEEQLWSIADDKDTNRLVKNLAKRELLLRYITGQLDNAEKKTAILEEVDTDLRLIYVYYSSNQIIKALSETEPDIFNKVVSLIHDQLEKYPTNTKASQALFEFYIDTSRDRDAEQLLTKHIEFQKRVRMNVPAKILHNVAMESKDERRLTWLLNLAKETSVRKAAPVYSHLVGLRAETDLQGALRAVADARAGGLEYNDLFQDIMRTVEKKLVSADEKVPWTLGMFAEKR